MKTYCKPSQVDIEDWKYNEIAVLDCFRNKKSRHDFQRFLCTTGTITRQEIAQDLLDGRTERILAAEQMIAKVLTQRIIDRDLQLKPIIQFQRMDGLTHKIRDICQETPKQQAYEYIAVHALKPLFQAKIMPIQYGSIPKRGGIAGKRKIERLLRRRFKVEKITAIKGDVTKAYPSVTVPVVMEMLRRDIGKNKVLLWFLEALMSNYPGNHLCIGGYLPAWLFNYVMSYVLRFLYEQCQIRRGKRKRLVYAVVCYADDFTVYGDLSKLKKAMKKATSWAEDRLGLCFIICGVINERSRCMPLIRQQLIAAFGITMIEFASGLILNVWLKLNMWDYSNMPGNILGQICPEFTALWFFLSAVGIFLDDLIRWRIFGEEKPHYHLFKKRKEDK